MAVKETTSLASIVVAGIALVAVLYVLSIGPVAGYVARQPGAPERYESLRSFYAPVIWLHDRTFLKEPLEAYVALFERS